MDVSCMLRPIREAFFFPSSGVVPAPQFLGDEETQLSVRAHVCCTPFSAAENTYHRQHCLDLSDARLYVFSVSRLDLCALSY